MSNADSDEFSDVSYENFDLWSIGNESVESPLGKCDRTEEQAITMINDFHHLAYNNKHTLDDLIILRQLLMTNITMTDNFIFETIYLDVLHVLRYNESLEEINECILILKTFAYSKTRFNSIDKNTFLHQIVKNFKEYEDMSTKVHTLDTITKICILNDESKRVILNSLLIRVIHDDIMVGMNKDYAYSIMTFINYVTKNVNHNITNENIRYFVNSMKYLLDSNNPIFEETLSQAAIDLVGSSDGSDIFDIFKPLFSIFLAKLQNTSTATICSILRLYQMFLDDKASERNYIKGLELYIQMYNLFDKRETDIDYEIITSINLILTQTGEVKEIIKYGLFKRIINAEIFHKKLFSCALRFILLMTNKATRNQIDYYRDNNIHNRIVTLKQALDKHSRTGERNKDFRRLIKIKQNILVLGGNQTVTDIVRLSLLETQVNELELLVEPRRYRIEDRYFERNTNLKDSFEILPYDLRCLVFAQMTKQLSLSQCLQLREVNKEFLSGINKYLTKNIITVNPDIENFSFDPSKNKALNRQIFWAYSDYKTVNLVNIPLSRNLAKEITNHSRYINKLHIRGCLQFDYRFITRIAISADTIQTLELIDLPVSDYELAIICINLRNLQVLTISQISDSFTGEPFEYLTSNIRRLSVNCRTNPEIITQALMKSDINNIDLLRFVFRDISLIKWEEFIVKIAINNFCLSYTASVEFDLSILTKIRGLKRLDIEEVINSNITNIHETCFRKISEQTTTLESLIIASSNMNINENFVKTLSNIKSLKELLFRRVEFDQVNIRLFSSFESLQSIGFLNCRGLKVIPIIELLEAKRLSSTPDIARLIIINTNLEQQFLQRLISFMIRFKRYKLYLICCNKLKYKDLNVPNNLTIAYKQFNI